MQQQAVVHKSCTRKYRNVRHLCQMMKIASAQTERLSAPTSLFPGVDLNRALYSPSRQQRYGSQLLSLVYEKRAEAGSAGAAVWS